VLSDHRSLCAIKPLVSHSTQQATDAPTDGHHQAPFRESVYILSSISSVHRPLTLAVQLTARNMLQQVLYPALDIVSPMSANMWPAGRKRKIQYAIAASSSAGISPRHTVSDVAFTANLSVSTL
jgi:hypothetical protein